jgi:hypothetical protein
MKYQNKKIINTMMKLTSTEVKTEVPKNIGKRPGFLYDSQNYIVLCTELQSEDQVKRGTFSGVVVYIVNTNGLSRVGTHSDAWFTEAFTPYSGTISLTQTL